MGWMGQMLGRLKSSLGLAAPPRGPISDRDRRRYRRVNAPIYTRPAPVRLTPVPVANIGVGGVRTFSDVASKVGKRLEIDLYLPDETSITCLVQVAWIEPLPPDAPAKFDVGLTFVSVPAGGMQKIREVLVLGEGDDKEPEAS